MLREKWVRFPGPAGIAAAVLLATAGTPAPAQIVFPTDSLELWLGSEEFELGVRTGSRFEADRTQRTVVHLPDRGSVLVKWAEAPAGGETFNNVPRYERAAYELQKLFLDEPDYVVPPTVLRAFPLAWYREHVDPGAERTFRQAEAVLVALQYWLFDVEPLREPDLDRARTDPVYGRHLANCNLLTHLIDHKDANLGNFLVSRSERNPRIFSVDNGVSFSSRTSDRGDWWRRLRVERLPRSTVDRLARIDRQELDRRLAVLDQFEVRDGALVRTAAGPSLGRGGVRHVDGVIQLGLTPREIDGLERRIERVLERVESGDIGVF